MNILLLSAGRRVNLVRYFRKALDDLGMCSSKVFTADSAPLYAAACYAGNGYIELPQSSSRSFLDALKSTCLKLEVQLVVPLTDRELVPLSRARESFSEMGISVIVGSSHMMEYANDKKKTSLIFEALGMNFPSILDPGTAFSNFPIFTKPQFGSLSVGSFVINNPTQYQDVSARYPENIYQEYIGPSYEEYTIDCYFDRIGLLKCLVPRKRLEVRGGEVSKSLTTKGPLYDYLFDRIAAVEGLQGVNTFQVFAKKDFSEIIGIELNARFGGGYPLSYEAGANYPKYLIKEYLLDEEIDLYDNWRSGLMMLRFDDHILVNTGDLDGR